MYVWVVISIFSQEIYFSSHSNPEQCMKAAIEIMQDFKEYVGQEVIPNVFRCVQIELKNPFRDIST